MLLPLEGAAGTKITIYNLDKARADLTIDGESVKRESNGDFKIPMASGGPEKLEVRSTFPGYPTIKFKGKTLYKAPKPPAVYSAAYVAMIVGATVLGASLGGIATAGAMTMGAGYVAPSLMLKARQKGIPLVWILLVGAGLGALGVAHFMASGMTR